MARTSSCRRRHIDAVLQGTRDGRRTGELVRFGQAKHPNGTSVDPSYWWSVSQEAAGAGRRPRTTYPRWPSAASSTAWAILDKQGNVIRDAMLWNDTSPAPQAAARSKSSAQRPHKRRAGRPNRPRQAALGQGRRLLPVASYTLTKVAWVAENEPENAKKIAAICLPHDWLSWRGRRLRPGRRRRGRPS
ncbi:MAG: FGGY family carbohydrate kinase [Bifidobacterium adolescentis]